MKNYLKKVPWPLLWILVTMFFMLINGLPSIAGSYPPYFTPSYSGMIKPQLNLMNYEGTPNAGHYSTVWGGKYSSPTSPPPGSSITPTSGIGEFTGRHAGVDITLGECYPTEPTEIRAVADGVVVGIVRNWIESNPEFTECGNNWAKFIVTPPTPTPVIYGLFGNYVIIKHNDFPEMGNNFGGTIYSIYTHLYSVEEDINVNDIVLRGTLLGYQGSTGYSSGSHLHFQIDRDISGKETHPYSYGNANEPYTPLLAEETFNPMYFVQAHIVQNEFSSDIQADYFLNKNLQGQPEETTFESSIDNDWYLNGPPSIPLNDEFSIRWGTASGAQALYIPQPGWWYFYITVNDGFRLWIDETLILQDWTIHSYPTTFSIGTFMSQGIHTIKIEYYEDAGYATIQLAWQRHTYERMLPLSQKHYNPDLPTPTPAATLTPTPSATYTPSNTPTRTPTATPSPTPCTADLSIDKTSDGSFFVGAANAYHITVKNLGPCNTDNVHVTDDLPNILNYVGYSGGGWQCTYDPRPTHVVSCIQQTPMAMDTPFVMELTVEPTTVGWADNVANVWGPLEDPNPADDEDTTHDVVNPGSLGDFDGDGDSDIALFRPMAGSWHHYDGATVFLGQEGDIPVPADYDGDGKSERAFFRPGSGEWTICEEIDINSGICDPSTYFFGQPGDIPAEKRPAYAGYPY